MIYGKNKVFKITINHWSFLIIFNLMLNTYYLLSIIYYLSPIKESNLSISKY